MFSVNESIIFALRLSCDAFFFLILVLWTLLRMIALSFPLHISILVYSYWIGFECASVGYLISLLWIQFESIKWIRLLFFISLSNGLGLTQSVLKSSAAHLRFACSCWSRCCWSLFVHFLCEWLYWFGTGYWWFLLLNWPMIPWLWLLAATVGILRCSLG